MKHSCQIADVCLSDYWGGHHEAHLSIPVDNTMKLSDVKEALLSELSQGAIAGSVDYQVLESDEFHTSAELAINAIEADTDGPVFTELEDDTDEDCESVMAIFILVPEE